MAAHVAAAVTVSPSSSPWRQAVKAIHPPCAHAFEYTYLIAFPEQDKTATEKQYLSLFICLDLVCTLAVYKYSY